MTTGSFLTKPSPLQQKGRNPFYAEISEMNQTLVEEILNNPSEKSYRIAPQDRAVLATLNGRLAQATSEGRKGYSRWSVTLAFGFSFCNHCTQRIATAATNKPNAASPARMIHPRIGGRLASGLLSGSEEVGAIDEAVIFG